MVFFIGHNSKKDSEYLDHFPNSLKKFYTRVSSKNSVSGKFHVDLHVKWLTARVSLPRDLFSAGCLLHYLCLLVCLISSRDICTLILKSYTVSGVSLPDSGCLDAAGNDAAANGAGDSASKFTSRWLASFRDTPTICRFQLVCICGHFTHPCRSHFGLCGIWRGESDKTQPLCMFSDLSAE